MLVVDAARTLSSCKIRWIPLPRLADRDCMILFENELLTAPKFLAHVIRACNGHCRSLEQLQVFWACHTMAHAMSLRDFMLLFSQHLKGFNTITLTRPILFAALRGDVVQLDDTPDKLRSYRECITLFILLHMLVY